jgi:hypothetical protein
VGELRIAPLAVAAVIRNLRRERLTDTPMGTPRSASHGEAEEESRATSMWQPQGALDAIPETP